VGLIDDAIGLEERARSYYEEAAGRVDDKSGRKILKLLADEEKRHAAALAEMKDGIYGGLEASSLIDEVRGLIEGAVKEGKDAVSTDASLRDILQKAMGIEGATRRFYEEKAASADEEKVKDLFIELAKQETSHYLLVSGLSEYFNRPAEWIESAEFGLRPEY